MMIIHRLAAAFVVTSSPLASAFAPSLWRNIPSLRAGSRMSYKKGVESEIKQAISSSANDLLTLSHDPIIAAPEPVTEPSESNAVDWHRTWLPVASVQHLDEEIPHQLVVLNKSLVMWRDAPVVDMSGQPIGFGPKTDRPKGAKRSNEGTWRVFEDVCPHRKVPLSDGRVEDDGTLMCSYHAWRFEGDGALCHAPQALPTVLDRLKNNPKASCNAYPTKVKDGILFVWLSKGSDARIESELTPLPDMGAEGLAKFGDVDGLSGFEVINESRVLRGDWICRSLPYGYDFFVENVIDSAHTAVAHHGGKGKVGISGNRYKEPRPFHATIHKSPTKQGFLIENTFNAVDPFRPDAKDGAVSSFYEFRPAGVRTFSALGKEGMHVLDLYVSPAAPGYSNVMGRQYVVKAKDGSIPSSGRAVRDSQIKNLELATKLPDWIGHIVLNKFLGQDALFLHVQERYLASLGGYSTLKGDDEPSDNYLKATTPGVQSDKSVILFRKWMKKYSNGRFPYHGNAAMPSVNIDEVFDVYNSHTKHCTSCSGALEGLRKVRLATTIAAGVVALWQPGSKLEVFTLVSVLVGTAALAQRVADLLVRMEFSHSKND